MLDDLRLRKVAKIWIYTCDVWHRWDRDGISPDFAGAWLKVFANIFHLNPDSGVVESLNVLVKMSLIVL